MASSAHRARLKVCCIADRDEAWRAIDAGASALGLVSAMPSGPGVISEQSIAEIAAACPPGIGTFLLTAVTDAAAVIRQVLRTGVNTVQLCDRLDGDRYADLRAGLPNVKIVQVIHVCGEANFAEAVQLAPKVDALLLDSGNPALAVKQLGGTGRLHDWQISRRIREAVGVPVFLAGGLTPQNIAAAIQAVGPFGLDVCSGLRSDGRLDPSKLAEAMTVLRSHPLPS